MLLQRSAKTSATRYSVSFIIGVKRVSRKNIGLEGLQFIGLGLELFNQFRVAIRSNDLVELGTVI